MAKMEDHLQSQSSLPLLSKPYRMDSFMKHITRNPNISRWRSYIFSFGRKNDACVPLNAAVLDANNKSYLLDRIESLEDRLIQLSLEIETQRTSRTSATTSTVSRSRELPVSSYPVFNNPKPKCNRVHSDVLSINNGCELEKIPERLERKQKRRNGKRNGDDHKNGKKKTHNWSHLKILGC
ncbi:hypothetical protein L6452_16527 [Arctium lappa]|uniref:Uncharacterized protein n=1 Tax=Arctium lappa TaxID=4217 RepID=A0ACB9C118_ARCLA|nr:hypothetical protein L6452_16527 [Arctium lappa]